MSWLQKSPGMAGKLELWLRSTQKGPTKPILEKNVDLIDEEKENVQIPENSPTNLDVQQGLTPRYEKKSISVQQRPSTSSQRRPLVTIIALRTTDGYRPSSC